MAFSKCEHCDTTLPLETAQVPSRGLAQIHCDRCGTIRLLSPEEVEEGRKEIRLQHAQQRRFRLWNTVRRYLVI